MLLVGFGLLSFFPIFSGAEPRHLPILRSGRHLSLKDHLAAAERTKARYGYSSTDLLSRDTQRRGITQSINITNELSDTYYYTEVSVGTPAQSFKVMIDTSTSDLWVGGTACVGCPTNVALYDHSKSSTTVNGTTVVTTLYGGNSVQGDVFTDIIRMGGYTVSQQTFWWAYRRPDKLLTSPVSGIFGFALAGLSKAGTTLLASYHRE
ncbi:aspartic peptidase domain-containing protein [Mycena olivaceomarginata]|nr:aspartic peptidase domain-containing protein [Mycena olivaceomarginata]